DLGVEDEDVDVATGAEDLVDAAEADVVGPAVAADDPDPGPDELAGERGERLRVGRERPVDGLERLTEPLDPSFLGVDLDLGLLAGTEDRLDRVSPRSSA